MLRDVLGDQTTEEVLEEIYRAYHQLYSLGWKEIRPWNDFFGSFKLPQYNARHIEQRVITNFLHYRSNYFAICVAVLCLQVLLAPVILLSLSIVAAVTIYLLVILKKPLTFGSISINDAIKRYFCGIFAVIMTATTGTLERLTWGSLYCVLICGLHMTFRPRSITAKVNKVYDEARLNNPQWFGGSGGDRTANAGMIDPENPSVSDSPRRRQMPTSFISTKSD